MREIRLERDDILIIRTSADHTSVEMLVARRSGRSGEAIVMRMDVERAAVVAERLLACAREVRHAGRMREIADEVRRRRRS